MRNLSSIRGVNYSFPRGQNSGKSVSPERERFMRLGERGFVGMKN